MKCRFGFVTNSSSSSFVIERASISNIQTHLIVNYKKVIRELNLFDDYDCEESDFSWEIKVTDDEVRGFTYIDNFDMESYLCDIGISNITWRD